MVHHGMRHEVHVGVYPMCCLMGHPVVVHGKLRRLGLGLGALRLGVRHGLCHNKCILWGILCGATIEARGTHHGSSLPHDVLRGMHHTTRQGMPRGIIYPWYTPWRRQWNIPRGVTVEAHGIDTP